jgi:hypothetical protein
LTQSASTWRAGNLLAKASKAQSPVGTTYTFKLDRTAIARFAFTQRVPGRRVGGKCVAQTNANVRAPRCTRTVAAGVMSIPAHGGTNKVRFEGRLSRTKKLKPGRYTLTLTASSSGLQSASRSLNFTIVGG